jgi:hypothetical protein
MNRAEAISATPAALRAGLSAESMRRKILRGEIKGWIREGKFYADLAALDAWIAEQRQAIPS